ncbi:MAG: CAP domain-containing protein [Planctomycetota bacterium]
MSLKTTVILLSSLLVFSNLKAEAKCPCRPTKTLVTASLPSRLSLDPNHGSAKIVVPFDAKVSVDDRELGGHGPVRWYRWAPSGTEKHQMVSIHGTWSDRVTGEQKSYRRRILVRPGAIRPVNLCGTSLESIGQTIVQRSNRHRDANGVHPLTMSETLAASAQKHADAMAKRKTLTHQLDGRSFVDRAEDEGYRFFAGAENIAEGAWSSNHVVEMWMRSPGHRKNLLSAEYTEVGVGTAWAEDGTRFDVQVFGRPAPKRQTLIGADLH